MELSYELSERLNLSTEFNNYYYFESSFPKYRYSINIGLQYKLKSKKIRDFQKRALLKQEINEAQQKLYETIKQFEENKNEIENQKLRQLQELKRKIEELPSNSKSPQNITI